MITIQTLLSSSKTIKRRSENETDNQMVARLAHASLVGKGIASMCLAQCRGLATLYLYDNAITRIEHVGKLRNLTALYLQNNAISRIEGLRGLPALAKLHLGHNRITLVEGLLEMPQLVELHIDHQQLPPGEKLLWDRRTVRALQAVLRVLNVAGNGLDSVADLQSLSQLTTLNVAHNALTHVSELAVVVANNPDLRSLTLAGNPCCAEPKYQDPLIAVSAGLVDIDGREITAVQRTFLANWRTHVQRSARAHAAAAASEPPPPPAPGPFGQALDAFGASPAAAAGRRGMVGHAKAAPPLRVGGATAATAASRGILVPGDGHDANFM